MTTRPAFDPSVYETAELGEMNRPLHALAWDMIEAERAERAVPISDRAGYEIAFAKMIAARKAHADALAAYDIDLASYLERAAVEDNGDAADQTEFAL
jgi:hypothetical protein